MFKVNALNSTRMNIRDYAQPPRLKGRRYVQYAGEFKTVPWFLNSGMDRKRITLANRIKSGHTKTKAHLRRMKIIEEDQCGCGEEVESADLKKNNDQNTEWIYVHQLILVLVPAGVGKYSIEVSMFHYFLPFPVIGRES